MVRPGHRADRALPHSFIRFGHLHAGAAALTGFRLSAGLVWPVSSPPIPNGALLIGAGGRIAEIGPDSQVAHPAGVPALAHPAAVLLPGLVNVHTHLELAGFAGTIEDPAFFDWIQHVRRAKAAATPEQFVEAARRAVREGWTGGVTCVADTGDTGAAATALTELGGRGVVYQEVFGPHPDQADDAIQGLMAAVQRLSRESSASVRIGVSPHAPYTVSAPLFRRVADFARSEGLPLAVHLAESKEESAFVQAGSGPFAELWKRRGIPLPEPRPSPVEYVHDTGILGPQTLVIHGVQTSGADRAIIRDAAATLALCPRSNVRHGHGHPPVEAYLEEGIPAGLGTDSAASVPMPDLFAEARAAGDLAGLSPSRLLRMLTLDGAVAIGLGSQVGSLERGKWADLCLMEGAGVPGEPADAVAGRLLAAGAAAVLGTWMGGRLVYARARQ